MKFEKNKVKNIEKLKEYFINLGFKISESNSNYFYMVMITPNDNHIDIQYSTENDRLSMRLLDNKHIEDEFSIENWNDDYENDLHKMNKRIEYWDKYY